MLLPSLATSLAYVALPTLAAEFVDLVIGPEGQKVLEDAGFGPP